MDLTIEEIRNDFEIVPPFVFERQTGVKIRPSGIMQAKEAPLDRPLIGLVKQSKQGDFALSKALTEFLAKYHDRACIALAKGTHRTSNT